MKAKPEKYELNDEIQHSLREMRSLIVGTEEYERAAKALKELYEARAEKEARWPVDIDTAVLAATNILGILIVLNYENLHVLSSKAFSLLKRV